MNVFRIEYQAPSPDGRATARTRRRNRFAAFGRGEDGSMAIFGLYLFIIILMVGGIGIDLMRAERDRANLQNSLDRAVLAATDLDQTMEPKAVVIDYFTKAGLSEYLSEEDITVTTAINSRTVSALAEANIATHFMHMTGLDSMEIPAVSAANETIPNMEISLVLDISGSMRFSSRMDSLKPAAKEFVSNVLTGGLAENTSINLIPYAGQTNPGPVMFDYLGGQRFGTTDDDYFPEWGQDISNIVIWFDRDGDGEIDYSAKIEGYPDSDVDAFNKDDLDEYFNYAVDYMGRVEPSLQGAAATIGATIKGGKQPTTFYSVTGEEVDGPTEFNQTDITLQFTDFYDEVIRNDLSSCIEMTSSDFQTSGLPTGSTEQVAHFMNWDIAADVMDWGWCPEDDTAIQYAQNDEASLHSFIDNLRMHDGTGTFYAMKYALALLDPATQPAFAHLTGAGLVPATFSTRPAQWNADDWAKYVVLLTDGQITEQVRPVDKLDPINATDELKSRPNSDSQEISSRTTNLQRFYDQCDLAKENGVVIFTIAFAAPSGASTEMRNCASSPSHFFESSTDNIGDAFSAISSSIRKLRLTQ